MPSPPPDMMLVVRACGIRLEKALVEGSEPSRPLESLESLESSELPSSLEESLGLLTVEARDWLSW